MEGDSTNTEMLRQALKRPINYNYLSSRQQWKIDKDLGILDWDPGKNERKKYLKLRKEIIHEHGR